MTDILQTIWNNKFIIFSLLVIVFMAVIWIKNFIKLPNNEKMRSIREWLLYAVTEAEKELGSGTGQIKLRMVYDMFIKNFIDVSRWISFDTFSAMVDEALKDFREMLNTNENLRKYVYGEQNAKEGVLNDQTRSN